jgi:hypothetical protein
MINNTVIINKKVDNNKTSIKTQTIIKDRVLYNTNENAL